MTTGYVSPVGYVDLDNDCAYSLDIKSTRSRESVDPKTDLAFYFNTYIEPVYGLGNINVKNCASFMKDLEMNWTKLGPELKDKVLQYMVDGIFTKDNSYDFKKRFLAKLGVAEPSTVQAPVMKSTFGEKKEDSNMLFGISIAVLVLCIILFLFDRLYKNKSAPYSKLS
jgi:hypothetical protein